MSVRKILVLSLVLNLVLAGLVVARLSRRTVAASSEPETVTLVTNMPRVVRQAAEAEADTGNPAVAASPWSLIETNDYPAYIANLRAVGCPEATLRHIIIADVEKLFAGRRDGERSEPNGFWLTGSQSGALNRQRTRRERELAEQERALIRELLGVDWCRKAHEMWVKEPETELFTGFLAPEKQLALLAVIFRSEQCKEEIQQEANGILIPEDEAKLRTLAEEMRRGWGGLLAPAESDEVMLRVGTMMAEVETEADWPGLNLTGTEYREIVKLRMAGKDLIAEMLDMDKPEPSDEQEAAAEEKFNAGLQTLLGAERAAGFLKTQEQGYKEIFGVAQKYNLPPELAAKAFEVREATETEVQRVRADKALTAVQRESALIAMGAEVQQALQSALGAGAAQEYLQQHGQWVPGQKKEAKKQ